MLGTGLCGGPGKLKVKSRIQGGSWLAVNYSYANSIDPTREVASGGKLKVHRNGPGGSITLQG